MWWEKKSRGADSQDARNASVTAIPPNDGAKPAYLATRNAEMPTVNTDHTVLGRSMILSGELVGHGDLLVEGQFHGTINLPENCVTVGAGGEVKAEVRARHVIVQGAVAGNISAGEKIEIRKTGHVVGDLVSAAVAIEDGAFFKGSIDIVRDQPSQAGAAVAAQAVGSEP